MTYDPDQPKPSRPWKLGSWEYAGFAGLLLLAVSWFAIKPYQVNIVRYELQQADVPPVISVMAFLFFLVFTLVFLVLLAKNLGGRDPGAALRMSTPLLLLIPLVATIPLQTPPPFFFLLLGVAGTGISAYLAGSIIPISGAARPRLAFYTIVAAIALLAFLHVRIQLNFYNHFMFGHADIGHFTEEFKNALAGRGLRSDSFDNTRLGWHFSPLLFVLVPGYALWPSITYLMTLGPLVLHLAALPVFWFVRRWTGSVLIAWVCAMAWLLLPSLSRLVYSNSYGFAWLYTSVPVLALLLGAALLERWKLCWILVGVLLLSRETHTAVTLGFGAYLTLFSVRRRAGLLIMAISVGYALLSAGVIIPYFAKAGRYERLDMFGELGGSIGALAMSAFTKPDVFFGRLIRSQSINFVLLLLTTMCFLPLRGWRLALAAVPSIVVHLLMQGTDWISIKFWHHAMVLPILFFAALCALHRKEVSADPSDPSVTLKAGTAQSRNLGIALALFMCAAWSHYLFGFSPLSKSFEVYADNAFLENPDPRLAFVERIRNEIPRDRSILATERLAAHFTDYKRLYTGRRIRLADFLVLDRSDEWDTSGLPQRASEFLASGDYDVHAEHGSIVVFARRPTAEPLPTED